jgi:hypothetical protein
MGSTYCYNFCEFNVGRVCLQESRCKDYQSEKTIAYAVEEHGAFYGILPKKLLGME